MDRSPGQNSPCKDQDNASLNKNNINRKNSKSESPKNVFDLRSNNSNSQSDQDITKYIANMKNYNESKDDDDDQYEKFQNSENPDKKNDYYNKNNIPSNSPRSKRSFDKKYDDQEKYDNYFPNHQRSPNTQNHQEEKWSPAHRSRSVSNNKEEYQKKENFVIKNGCCRACMRAFSKSGKSCLCQVPKHERKYLLSEKGCNYCGCQGCNPLDIKRQERKERKKRLLEDSHILYKKQRILDSDDDEIPINLKQADDFNRYRRDLEKVLKSILDSRDIDIYGFGAPMRKTAYILGYNPKYTDPVNMEEERRDKEKRERNYN